MKNKNRSFSRAEITPELVERARGGDQAACAALYEQINPALYRTVRAMIRDEDLAWDVLQNSWLRAFRSLDQLEANEAFLPWLRRIAVNEAVRQVARRQPASFTELGDGADEAGLELPDPDPTVQPELALDRKETSRLVRKILAELPEQQQLVVGMRYYEDMSVREIAEALGVASGTVKAQLFQGRKKVEAKVRALERQGVKLYGLGPIPFLAALVRGLEPARAAEKKTLASVLAKTPAAGGAARAGSAAAAGTVLETSAAPVTITAMTAGRAFLHGLGARLLAGVLAFALVGGGLWAGGRLLKDRQPVPGDPTVIKTEAPPIPNQTAEPKDETGLPGEEPVGNECGAEGDNLTWRFDEETGTLIIEGSGAMADYGQVSEANSEEAYYDDTPWHDYSLRILKVSLPEGLSSIGSGAFFCCEYLNSIEIPESVTSIGDNAFMVCTSLSRLEIPESVTSIGDNAFARCMSLNRLEIPAGVRSIGRNVFAFTNIQEGVFVAPDNPAYRSDERGVLFTEDGTVLLYCPPSVEGSYTVPDTVRTISEFAFESCHGLTAVTIPEGVTDIGDGAFDGCEIAEVTLPASLRSLGKDAFGEGYYAPAFFVADGNSVYASDSNGALFNADRTELLRVPGSYKGAYQIPETVAVIGESAFYDCYDLTAVTIPDGVGSIGGHAFSGCYDLTAVTIPDSVSTVGDYAFYGCSSLSVVTIPDRVGSIGDCTFFDCYNLTAVTIPDGVGSIGVSAFSGCCNLTAVTIPDSVSTIGDYAFSGCSLTTVTIPDSVSTIGDYAFSGCSLTTVTIPGSVRSLGSGAFDGAVSAGFSVDPDNPAYSSDARGALFNKDQTVLLCIPRSLEAYSVPETVTEIADAAFSGCWQLRTVTIPEGVTGIGDDAFSNCSELVELTLPDSLRSIGANAFNFCDHLRQLSIPRSVTSISPDAFVNCRNLRGLSVSPGNPAYSSDESGVLFNRDKTVLIQMLSGFYGDYSVPESVVTIGESAFANCGGLQAVSIPDGVRSIGSGAFQWCSALREVRLPDGIAALEELVFADCSSLESVTIPAGVKLIGEYAFFGCTELRSATVLADEISFGMAVFEGCPELTVRGCAGGAAEAYAAKYGIPFAAIEP